MKGEVMDGGGEKEVRGEERERQEKEGGSK